MRIEDLIITYNNITERKKFKMVSHKTICIKYDVYFLFVAFLLISFLRSVFCVRNF